MKVTCSARDKADGTASLIAVLRYYYDKYPQAKIAVDTDMFTDRHTIDITWSEER